MENGSWSWEQKTLINEVIQGMEMAKQLRLHLRDTSSTETKDALVQGLLCSFEKALLILNWNGSTQHHPNLAVPKSVPESPVSTNESPPSDLVGGARKDNQSHDFASKKRKRIPTWTDQVRTSSAKGLRGDGYIWRKYGQKDIHGAKYPRCYYRCTYKNTQNCCARKQVQRSAEDPTILEITYQGAHTCSLGQQSVQPPTSLEKQDQKPNSNEKNCQFLDSHGTLLNMQEGLTVNTEFKDEELICFPYTNGCIQSVDSYYSPYLSPSTPEPNPFPVSGFHMDNFGGIPNLQHSDSDFAELISVDASASNSPILDLDFTLDQVEFDQNFPFDTPEFFP